MPTELRLLRGNRGKRPINASEPRPEKKAPVCPRHLDAGARREWRRLSRVLMSRQLLTEVDGMALACLCQTWSLLEKAQGRLNETGLLFKTPSGYVQQSPLVSIVNSCTDLLTKLGREFGLTPAARCRMLGILPEEADDHLQDRETARASGA